MPELEAVFLMQLVELSECLLSRSFIHEWRLLSLATKLDAAKLNSLNIPSVSVLQGVLPPCWFADILLMLRTFSSLHLLTTSLLNNGCDLLFAALPFWESIGNRSCQSAGNNNHATHINVKFNKCLRRGLFVSNLELYLTGPYCEFCGLSSFRWNVLFDLGLFYSVESLLSTYFLCLTFLFNNNNIFVVKYAFFIGIL